jgi:hypothetical protein
MKKSIILIIVLITSQVVIAPNISNGNDLYKRLMDEYDRIEYANEFNRFISHLGYKESSNNWKSINSIGCVGEYQFAPSTLKYLGYHNVTVKRFSNDPNIFPPEMQLEALNKLITINMIILNDYLSYSGIVINNITITKAGLIAGAHLGGAGNVKLFLLSNGKIDKHDLNNTKISSYIKEFSLYKL